jgi:hypothetical protein
MHAADSSWQPIFAERVENEPSFHAIALAKVGAAA